MLLARLRGRNRASLILLSPYKFRATKTLYSFRPVTRRKRDITSAIPRGNTRAVWPDRVTIRTRDIRLKRRRFINQKLAKCDRGLERCPPPSPPYFVVVVDSRRFILIYRIVHRPHRTRSIELNSYDGCPPCFLIEYNVEKPRYLSTTLHSPLDSIVLTSCSNIYRVLLLAEGEIELLRTVFFRKLQRRSRVYSVIKIIDQGAL